MTEVHIMGYDQAPPSIRAIIDGDRLDHPNEDFAYIEYWYDEKEGWKGQCVYTQKQKNK